MTPITFADLNFRRDNVSIKVAPNFVSFKVEDYTTRMGMAEITNNDATALATHILTEQNEQETISTGDLRALAVELLRMANLRDMPVLAQEKPKKPAPQRRYGNLSPQAQTIYRHIERAGSISAREAMADHGITSASLARRMCDIEEEGFSVVRERRVHPLTGKNYTRYALSI